MPGRTFKVALDGHRNTLFCGRAQALARLDAFVAAEAPRVCHLHGPGGIGKTYLLRHWLRRQALEPAQAFWLDAAEVTPTQEAIEDAFEPVRRGGDELQLVVVDNYHRWGAWDSFARECVFAALPGHLHIIIAGRNYPDAAWLGDTGWQAILDLLFLPPLQAAEAAELLALLQVPAEERAALLLLTAGNPLGLTLGASLARAHSPGGPAAQAPVLPAPAARAFSSRLVLRGFVTAWADALGLSRLERLQWEALECCALAAYVDEAMLRRLLADQAAEAMGWLRHSAMTETTGLGLRMLECFRRAVLLRSHFETPHRLLDIADDCAGEHLQRAVETDTARWHEALPWVAHAAQAVALAHEPLRAASHGLGSPYHLAACDHAAVAPLLNGGERGARLGARLNKLARDRFLLAARAEPNRPLTAVFSLPFTAHRDMDRLRGAFDIRAGDTPPDLVAALPIAAQVADPRGLARQLLLVALARHLCKASPAGTLLLFPVQLELPTATGAGLELRQARGAGLQGWRGLWLSARQAANADHALGLLHTLHGGRCKRGDALPVSADQAAEPIDAAGFKLAVFEALRHFSDARRLAQNPIAAGAGVRLVPARGNGANGDAQDGVIALRELLRTAVERLGSAPRNQKHVQALNATYLVPRGQKTAAAELNMAYSTFRRHLHDAREMVAAELWQQEMSARRSAM